MGKPVRLTEVFLAVFPCKRRGVVPRRSVKMEVSNRMEAVSGGSANRRPYLFPGQKRRTLRVEKR